MLSTFMSSVPLVDPLFIFRFQQRQLACQHLAKTCVETVLTR